MYTESKKPDAKVTEEEKKKRNQPDGETPNEIKAEIVKENAGAKDDKPSKDGKDSTKELDSEPATSKEVPTPKPSPVPPKPAFKEYILDGKIYYMREAQYRQRLQALAAKKVSSMLPSVPANKRA
jgi:hypothetical protein